MVMTQLRAIEHQNGHELVIKRFERRVAVYIDPFDPHAELRRYWLEFGTHFLAKMAPRAPIKHKRPHFALLPLLLRRRARA